MEEIRKFSKTCQKNCQTIYKLCDCNDTTYCHKHYATPQALCFKFLSCLNKGCDDDDDDDDCTAMTVPACGRYLLAWEVPTEGKYPVQLCPVMSS